MGSTILLLRKPNSLTVMFLLRHQNFVNNFSQFYQPLVLSCDMEKGEKLSLCVRLGTDYVLRTPFVKLKKDGLPLLDINT